VVKETKISKISKKAFKEAYKNTCAAFKKKVSSDISTELDGLTELINDIVTSEIRPEIEKTLPQDARVHNMAVGLLDSTLGTVVDKAAKTAWGVVSVTFDAARKSVIEVFQSKTQIVVEASRTVKDKINSTVAKLLDPAIEQIVKVGQLVGTPISKGVTILTQDVVKQKQSTIDVVAKQLDNGGEDAFFSSTLSNQVINFKKSSSSIDEVLKVAAAVGKDLFPILDDFAGIFNVMIDIVALHFDVIATAVSKIFNERALAEKELSKDSSADKFNAMVEQMQARTRAIIAECVPKINSISDSIDWKISNAFIRFPNISDNLSDFASQLPGFDLDGLQTFREQIGIQAKLALPELEKEKNSVAVFRKALKAAAHIAIDFSQGQVLSALNDAFRETVKGAALYKLKEEFIPKCLELAAPVSDAIPSILKDIGFDLPQLVADAVVDKAEEAVDKLMDAVQNSVLQNLKSTEN